MRIEDKISIEIDQYFRLKFDELSNEVGPYSNIVGIFYHELMKYFTNYIIIKYSKYEFKHEIDFPCLNSNYCDNPFELNFNDQDSNLQNNFTIHNYKLYLKRLLQNFGSLTRYNKIRVGILYPKLTNHLIDTSLSNIRISIINNKKVFIYNYDYQISYLRDNIIELSQNHKINNPDIFSKNFINFISNRISKDKIKTDCDYLLIGSNGELNNRCNASNYLYEDKKVISLAHGHACATVLDDPYIGYGELSYCTDYISYGSRIIKEGFFNKSLQKRPNIHQRSSKIIKKYYSNDNIDIISNSENSKILYLSTELCGNRRYGPFRDIDDQIYIDFQKSIIRYDKNVFYKPYPNQKLMININNNRVINNDLKNIYETLEDYDLIVLDYFSTAFHLVCASKKPIIYFNLGLRNISSDVLEDIKKRVFYYDIDIENEFDIQIREAFNDYYLSDNKYINNYTKNYSLNNNK